MSKEKKLNRYAEDRLASYSNAEDSLARLKREQAASDETAREKARSRSILKKAVVSFSVAAVVIVTIALVWVGALSKMASPTWESAKTSNGSGNYSWHSYPNTNTDSSQDGSSYQSETSYNEVAGGSSKDAEGNAATELNGETTYVRFVFPNNAVSSEKVEQTKGYYYSFSFVKSEITIDALVAFGEIAADGIDFETNKTATVAGQTFLYAMGENGLRGKIVTDRETVYARSCSGAGEEAILAFLRETFIAK